MSRRAADPAAMLAADTRAVLECIRRLGPAKFAEHFADFYNNAPLRSALRTLGVEVHSRSSRQAIIDAIRGLP